ncbi:hypothetical protein B0T19DRAFT_438144 [Cercophora scortea]|uniref:Transcription factor RfeG n=1 Tax=Cercophora scortea TaxID=314031 RepID=A0AAE0J6K0_9PEZI|nr:hypothetical protein B0T19DRAFT_438144 [Cercophora scortea]
MASKNSYRAQQQQQTPANQPSNIPAQARQNEYFVPRDGIDREVITSDICRYLGNDALVRPGTYEAPDGRVTQGYFITAYRNLTSAMIQDLKADSARWEAERRAASGRPGGAGGTIHYSSQPNGNFRRSSNSPLAGSREQPRGSSDYSTWKNRQQREQDPFSDPAYGGMAMDIDSYPAPPVLGASKTPGYGPGPYSGAQMGTYPAVSYPPQILPGAGQYPAQAYGYPTNPATQYSPGPQSGDRYPGLPGPPAMTAQYGQDSSFIHGSNYQTSPGYVTSGPVRTAPLSVSSAAPTGSLYVPMGGAYGRETDYSSYPQPAGVPVAQNFPSDPLYGRGAYATATTNPPPASSDDLGSPAGTTQPPRQGYGLPEPQYEEHQAPIPQATPTSTSDTAANPMATSGPSDARRNNRGSEPRQTEPSRDYREHRSRRSEQEREERLGTDRPAKHRHGHRS